MSFQPQMKPEHARAFSAAARHFDVYILVRRTNLMSLRFIGDKSCVPKRLDCKAKTADRDYAHPRFGHKETAGLVADPHIVGPSAYSSSEKHAAALKEWSSFATTMIHPAVATFQGQRGVTYVPDGKHYFVDLDPASPRHGCVKFSAFSLLSAGKYIHGDFDLYGIVPAKDPSRNVAVSEKRLEQKHSRSPEFLDVQIYVNRLIGIPMVLHGAQEAYGAEHSNEGLDVFHPDGPITAAEGKEAIETLYATTFKGRKLFTKDGPRDIVLGGFVTPR